MTQTAQTTPPAQAGIPLHSFGVSIIGGDPAKPCFVCGIPGTFVLNGTTYDEADGTKFEDMFRETVSWAKVDRSGRFVQIASCAPHLGPLQKLHNLSRKSNSLSPSMLKETLGQRLIVSLNNVLDATQIAAFDLGLIELDALYLQLKKAGSSHPASPADPAWNTMLELVKRIRAVRVRLGKLLPDAAIRAIVDLGDNENEFVAALNPTE